MTSTPGLINEEKKKQFEDLLAELQARKQMLERRYSTISTLRVISFLAGAALLLVGIMDHVTAAGIGGGLCLLLFICLVKTHADVVRNTEIVDSEVTAAERYMARFGEGWHEFDDDGSAYLAPENTVASDVDLLGPDSLYQMISVCHTEEGKRRLAASMKLDDTEASALAAKGEAVRELIDMQNFAVNFEAAGIRLERRKKRFDYEVFEQACMEEQGKVLPVWANMARFLLPAVWFVLLGLSLGGVINYGLPLVGFLVILAFSWLTRSVTDAVIRPLYSVGYALDDYMDMMREIEQTEFSSELLSLLQGTVSGENGALPAFLALRKISQAYNICFNPLLHQLLSGALLWDYQLAGLVERWKRRYGRNVGGCFANIGAFEEMLSLSMVGVVRKTGRADISYADCAECSIQCENLYHPLIAPDRVQENSADLHCGITIITGSNMSGKTTFLRTVAINLALAYMGAPICGKALTANYMKLFTSMRITDDVAHGISTFYAEILRIKAMADYRKQNRPMLCLIDEIFKGTNSADRIVGAREVITGLAGKRCITIVSTHDFELCSIEDREHKAAENYHFEEYYEENELKFDYKIRQGRCTTTNARAILRMAGFDVSD